VRQVAHQEGVQPRHGEESGGDVGPRGAEERLGER
jgi:hypothetical protein